MLGLSESELASLCPLSIKRLKESLNLSDTCEQISKIMLRLESGGESCREASSSSYSINEKLGESSIMEPSCSKLLVEERIGESSIIEPSCSKTLFENFQIMLLDY